MVVFAVTRGLYEDRYVQGIYDSLDRAIASCPGNRWVSTVWTYYPDWPSKERIEHHESTSNDLDWQDHCEIEAMEVVATGALRPTDEIVLQTLNTKGGWDYLPISRQRAEALRKGEPDA